MLRKEHRLRVFENRVLMEIFGPEREEVTGGWRKLHEEELHNIIYSCVLKYCYYYYYYYYYYKNARLRRARHVAPLGTKINSYKLLV
jgi:hypothetical protein